MLMNHLMALLTICLIMLTGLAAGHAADKALSALGRAIQRAWERKHGVRVRARCGIYIVGLPEPLEFHTTIARFPSMEVAEESIEKARIASYNSLPEALAQYTPGNMPPEILAIVMEAERV
jgi:hypothetical protein